MPTIQDAVQAAAPGDIVKIPAGVYDVSNLVLPSNITLEADGNVTLTGNLTVGSNTTVKGFTFENGSVDLGSSSGATIADNTFNGGSTSVAFDGASNAHIINNSFNNVAGGVIGGWGLNQSTIAGNHFANASQGISLDFSENPSQGNDITVEGNSFTNISRMSIEVGAHHSSNLVIRDNWSDNSMVTNPGNGGPVAYSIISPNGVNTLIDGNYAKGASGPGIGIELSGAGEVKNNSMDTFQYGIIVYGSGFNVHDNHTANTSIASVLNYSNGDGVIANNTVESAITPPPQPSAVAEGTATPADPAPTDPSGHTSDHSASGAGTPTDGTTAQQDVPPTQSADHSTAGQSADASGAGTPTDGTTAQQDASPTQSADHSTAGQSADASGAGTPTDGTTAQQDVPPTQSNDGLATVSFHGVTESDAAMTATDAASLEAAYQTGIDQHHSTSINFDIEGSAALDQNSISLRDHALADLEAANPNLKVGFTVTAQSSGLDANALNVLQSAKDDGVRIDAIKVLIKDAGQSADGSGHGGLASAATAAEKQLADLGLDAKVGFAWDGNSGGAHAHDAPAQDAHAQDAHGALSDSGGMIQQPFQFSGIQHHDHIG